MIPTPSLWEFLKVCYNDIFILFNHIFEEVALLLGYVSNGDKIINPYGTYGQEVNFDLKDVRKMKTFLWVTLTQMYSRSTLFFFVANIIVNIFIMLIVYNFKALKSVP